MQLQHVCEYVLITAHMDQLLLDIRSFVESEKLDDIARMAQLLSRVKGGTAQLLEAVKTWVVEQGTTRLRAAQPVLDEHSKLPKVSSGLGVYLFFFFLSLHISPSFPLHFSFISRSFPLHFPFISPCLL